jgi:hypothetical protein
MSSSFIFIATTYLFFEYKNYIRYKKLCHTLITTRVMESPSIDNVPIFKEYLEREPDIVDEFFEMNSSDDKLTKGDLNSVLSKSLYYKLPEECTVDETEIVHECIMYIENKLNVKFTDVHEQKHEQIGFPGFYTKLNPLYKSFMFEIMMKFCKKFFDAYVLFNGIIYTKYNGIYFYKNCKDDERETVILMHGLGIGNMSLLKLINKLQTKFNVVSPVIPNISQMYYIHDLSISINEFARICANFLKDYKYTNNKIHVIGHSYGTYIMTPLMEQHGKMFDTKILIDPVNFMVKTSKLLGIAECSLQNYIMQSNSNVQSIEIMLDLIAYWIILRDPYVLSTFKDRVKMEHLTYHKHLDNKTSVFICEHDSFIDSLQVYEYLKTNNKIKVKFFEGIKHGYCLFDDYYINIITNELN